MRSLKTAALICAAAVTGTAVFAAGNPIFPSFFAADAAGAPDAPNQNGAVYEYTAASPSENSDAGRPDSGAENPLFPLFSASAESSDADAPENGGNTASALPPWVTGTRQYFSLDPVTDGILIGAGVGLNAAALILDKAVHFKDTDYDGKEYHSSDVNPFDCWNINPYSRPLDIAGSVVMAAALLSPAALLAAPKDDWLTIGAMYAETLLISYGLKELGKSLVKRARPYMYTDDPSEDGIDSGDWCCSFPSGHTTLAFAGASFTSFVFLKYYPRSPWAFPVTAGACSLAAGTMVLRLCSGNHFTTDVLAGAALGTLTGILVPYLHTLAVRKSGKSGLQVSALPNGICLRVSLR